MTEQQLKDLYIQTEHGTFTPIYTYDDFIFNEEIEEYEYIGLVIQKSADEVYQEWLESKDKPIVEGKTLEDKISILEEENIKSQQIIADLEIELLLK